jgi:hypothetical protein
MVAIVAASWPAPVSIQIVSPTVRLAVLVSRTPVAPAADAWFKVVPLAVPREKLLELSTARYRTAVLPSWESRTLDATDGPAVIGASTHVAPPSNEYCSFETATSSVADRFSVCGAVMRQLLLPFGGDANAAGAATGATLSAAMAGAAAIKLAVAPANSILAHGRWTKSLIDFPSPRDRSQRAHSALILGEPNPAEFRLSIPNFCLLPEWRKPKPLPRLVFAERGWG